MTRPRVLAFVAAALLATSVALPAAATVEPTSQENLDRIDEPTRPLDGNYAYPDTAGAGVNVFILSTGIRVTHSEFETNRARFGGSFCDGCNEEDEHGRGTHLASIVVGTRFGVAKKATAVAVRTIDEGGDGSASALIAGMGFVGEEHSNSPNKNTVVLVDFNSLVKIKAVNDAVLQLTNAGVHVVVPAGNHAVGTCLSSPASEPSAITVGAIRADADRVTLLSSGGPCVDIFAPGRPVTGAGIADDNASDSQSGTEQAAAHVAGAIALIIAKDGNSSPAEMATTLTNLATKNVIAPLGLKGAPNRLLRVPAP